MAKKKPNNEDAKRVSETILSTAGQVAGDAIYGPIGSVVGAGLVAIVSLFKKRLVQYWVNTDQLEVDESLTRIRNDRPDNSHLPPFAVIGIGRCGSHVTAELAQMIAQAVGSSVEEESNRPNRRGLFSSFFNNAKTSGQLMIEPIMVVGDIDETTFSDVAGLVGDTHTNIGDRILKIDYSPLAVGGAGHVPIFAEFITRGLLALPPEADSPNGPPWLRARSYLIDSCSSKRNEARLVFYIFSAGGGTGAGGAAEIMRAQRFAMLTIAKTEPQAYFTGFAVLPADLTTSRRHLINAGRTVLQYLAELNIGLDSANDYWEAPKPKGSATVNNRAVQPWDGLALISNDVMSAAYATKEGATPSREQVETDANQYIAQQIFNLAAAQLPAASFQETGDVFRTRLNFQSIRLDPHDLRLGLVGPYAVCFSAANENELLRASGVDEMFLRSLQTPVYKNLDDGLNLVEGISIAPEEDRNAYSGRISELLDTIRASGKGETGKSITKEDLQEISAIPMFRSCPRAVAVFTAPQPETSTIPANIEYRLADLMSWLLPNLTEVRYAIIRGTTTYYSLSLYLEGSVVLAPDVQNAIRNYIFLCWDPRSPTGDEFKEKYASILSSAPPLNDEELSKWLGPKEKYQLNVPNFDHALSQLNRRWQVFVQDSSVEDARKEELLKMEVADQFLTPQEIVAALRYINYMEQRREPPLV